MQFVARKVETKNKKIWKRDEKIKMSHKANQPERKSQNLIMMVRLILILVRFASWPIRTDLWRPLVASLLVENTQRKLLDIM